MDDSPSNVYNFGRDKASMISLNLREKMRREVDVARGYFAGIAIILVREAVYQIVAQRVVRFHVIVRRGIAIHEVSIN